MMTDFPTVAAEPHFWIGYLAGALVEIYARTGDRVARDSLLAVEAVDGLSDRQRTRLRLRMVADRQFACEPDPSCGADEGYDTSDPKHPEWFSTHTDIWDNREKGQ